MILALNMGATALKFAAYDDDTCVARGVASNVIEILDRVPRPRAIGHRLAHGGTKHVSPALVDDALLADLTAAIEFAPHRLPGELEAITTLRARMRDVPQVACFDTAFFATLPQVARTRPDGSRSLGMHGISYESIIGVLSPAQLRRAAFAHLGTTSSVATVRDGQAIDITPIIDRDGWLALARTLDMHQLLQSRSTDPRAALAFDVFCHAVKKAIGGAAATLDGLDTLVFTGGIGEHAAAVVQTVCD
ncbi:MAG: acetate/propionate family kinase, partial [Deltaproteobacteria bacterium]|nr:acetate/propionate family kinase [Deltaproteobacteria bacterium]